MESELRSAVQNNDLKHVKLLLKRRINVNHRYNDGATILSVACEKGNALIVDQLLRKGASLEMCRDALIVATKNCFPNCVKLLMRHGTDPNFLPRNSPPALFIACMQQHFAIAHILLENGANPNVCYGNRSLAFCLFQNLAEQRNAPNRRHIDLVHHLLDKGMIVNSHDNSVLAASWYAFRNGVYELVYRFLSMEMDACIRKSYSFAVFYSVSFNWLDVLERLLNRGAPVNELTEYMSPLYLACSLNDVDAIRLLLHHDANANLLNKCGLLALRSPLQAATYHGNHEVIALLAENGATIDELQLQKLMQYQLTHRSTCRRKLSCRHDSVTKERGSALLHSAFDSGQIFLCELLVKTSIADIRDKDADGRTILAKAIAMSQPENVGRILELGADMTEGLDLILHHTCVSTTLASEVLISTIERVVQCGANVNSFDANSKETALQRVIRLSRADIVKTLIAHGAAVDLSVTDERPLVLAVLNDCPDIVEVLLKAGADVARFVNSRNETVLHLACTRSDVTPPNCTSALDLCGASKNVVELLLDYGVNKDAVCSEGETAVYKASLNGHVQFLRALVAAGADVNKGDSKIPLQAACVNKHLDVVQLLLESGARLDIRDQESVELQELDEFNNDSLPLLAVRNGDNRLLNVLLSSCSSVDERRRCAKPALLYIVDRMMEDTAQIDRESYLMLFDLFKSLLNYLFDTSDPYFYRVLETACADGQEDIVQQFVMRGADPAHVAPSDQTLLEIACDNAHVSIIRLLLRRLPRLKARDVEEIDESKNDRSGSRRTPLLFIPARNGCLTVLRLLLDSGYFSNEKDTKTGQTALHVANSAAVVELLITYQANTNVVNLQGETPLSNACMRGSLSVVQALLKGGANTNFAHSRQPLSRGCRSRCGPCIVPSPLCIACAAGHDQIVLALLDCDANVAFRDSTGNTPLHYTITGAKIPPTMLDVDRRLKIIDLLVSRWQLFDINAVNSDEKSALHLALELGLEFAAMHLLHYGAAISLSLPALLLLACENGNAELANFWLDRGADVNSAGSETPLCVAAARGHDEVVGVLLHRGASVHLCDDKLNTPAHLVATISTTLTPENVETVVKLTNVLALLFDCGADPNAMNKYGMTPLAVACATSGCANSEIVEALLRHRADPNITLPDPSDGKGVAKPPLITAACHGNTPLVDRLVRHGANVDIRDSRGYTALHHIYEPLDIDGLIALGASPNTTNSCGETPLFLASLAGIESIVWTLLKYGANPNYTTSDRFPLCIALEKGHGLVVESLLAACADPNVKPVCAFRANSTYRYRPPLIIAAVAKDDLMVRRLIKHGANVNIQDTEGRTALRCLIDGLSPMLKIEDDPCFMTLLQHGANVNLPCHLGSTPLFVACLSLNHTLVKTLLKLGSFVDGAGSDGGQQWPLVAACAMQDVDTVDLLLLHGANPNVSNPQPLPNTIFRRPLSIAAAFGNMPIFRKLIDCHADVRTPDTGGQIALHLAIGNMSLTLSCKVRSVVRSLPCSRRPGATSPGESMLSFLLARGASVNDVNDDGETPLCVAAREGLFDVAELLLRYGADPNLTGLYRHKYALCCACTRHDEPMVELLLSYGANPTLASDSPGAADSMCQKPLCIAARGCQTGIIVRLLDAGASVAVCLGGHAPLPLLLATLHHSSTHTSGTVHYMEQLSTAAQLMLERGADPNIASREFYAQLNMLLYCCDYQYYVEHHMLLSQLEAVRDKVIELVRRLIIHGARLDDSEANLGRFLWYRDFGLHHLTRPLGRHFSFVLELLSAGAGPMLVMMCHNILQMTYTVDKFTMCIPLCQALILSGYVVSESECSMIRQLKNSASVSGIDELLELVEEERSSPPTLNRLCRVAIRRCISRAQNYRSLTDAVECLPLPRNVKRYLLFEGPFMETELRETNIESFSDEEDELSDADSSVSSDWNSDNAAPFTLR